MYILTFINYPTDIIITWSCLSVPDGVGDIRLDELWTLFYDLCVYGIGFEFRFVRRFTSVVSCLFVCLGFPS